MHVDFHLFRDSAAFLQYKSDLKNVFHIFGGDDAFEIDTCADIVGWDEM